LLPRIKEVRQLADRLDQIPLMQARIDLLKTRRFLEENLLSHDEREDTKFYPLVAQLIGGGDATATITRAHLEIAHLVTLLGRTIDDLPSEGPDPEDVREIRRILYSLYAIISLGFAQEEQSFLTVLDSGLDRTTA
jgi:hypothetical protein